MMVAALQCRMSNSQRNWSKKIKSQNVDELQPHLSASGSKKTPSRSSPALPLLGTNRPGVDVLTMGTDWEASSLLSD